MGQVTLSCNNLSIDELSYEDFQRVQEVNVNGIWLCCRSVIPSMKQAGSGRIINMASTLGVVGLSNRTPYTASKGAAVQMTRALGMSAGRQGGAVTRGTVMT